MGSEKSVPQGKYEVVLPVLEVHQFEKRVRPAPVGKIGFDTVFQVVELGGGRGLEAKAVSDRLRV